ncbi:GAF domain-containing protein [Desulfovibrio mangrovi]|uniref:sensor domain-containing diguanylate cyclase n=1 Tax=Desulfovibrio mangrovi TaxID=2976983 RepID=UPI002245EF76|nr:GAF domain-containing protein [Desulfovibrio mangrovi]UZP67397.1 GAF domain-containing protein [Desulfovibrio mangrovi]
MAVTRLNPKAESGKGRLIYIVETLLGLMLITVLNVLLFKTDIGFMKVQPHPYWIVVILIAVRYGFFPGFFAGFMSGMLYLLFKTATIPDISLLELHSIELWGPPLLFWVTGMALGEIRQGHMRELDAVQTTLKESLQVADEQKRELQTLEQAKVEMDTRIFSQEHTLSTIYEAAQALRTLDADSIYMAILDLLRQYLDVEECSIYIMENNSFQLKASKRTTSPRPKGILGPETEPLYTVYKERKAVTIDAALRNESDNAGMLIAAPVLSSSGLEAVGVLVVERMPFLKFNPASIRMVELIADWCGASLENALLHRSTKEKLITDEIADVYNYKYLRRRLNEEFQRAKRYGLELSLIHLEIPGFTERIPEEQQATLIAFAAVVQSHLRNIDLVFLHEQPGAFVVVLPTTPLQGAKVVVNNIARAYQALVIMSFELEANLMALRVGTAAMTAATNDMDELLAAVTEDIHDAVIAA